MFWEDMLSGTVGGGAVGRIGASMPIFFGQHEVVRRGVRTGTAD